MNITADKTIIDENDVADEKSESDSKPSDKETESPLTDKEKISLMWEYYSGAKEHINRENELYNPNTAVELLIKSAKQLLHSIKSNRNWSATLGSLRLLGQISRIIQNRLDDERKNKSSGIDRKLRRKIDEKKQAHGLKQSI